MEGNKLKISIITASYNYEQLIKETIESVINQTYTNWELIIVDDGSVDNSVEVIKKYCEIDDRIKFFQHENGVNKGLKDTVLLGLEKASCEWVAFLESDDVFMPNYLEEKVKIINSEKDAGLIFNDVEFFGDEEQIKIYDVYLEKRTKVLSSDKISYVDWFQANFIPTFSCVMVKKDLLLNCDFNSPMLQTLDWILWTQLINKTRIIYMEKNLTRWRIHPKSYINSSIRDKEVELFSKVLKYLNDNKHNNLWIELYAFINKPKIEKLLRPQVAFVSDLILNYLLKNKVVKLIKV